MASSNTSDPGNGTPGCQNSSTNGSTPLPALPAAPDPSTDPGVIPIIQPLAPNDDDYTADIFILSPESALKMLCRSIDALVQATGDVPPTPPLRSRPQSPARLNEGDEGYASASRDSASPQQTRSDCQSGRVPFAKTPIGSPEAHYSEPTTIVGANAEPVYIQQAAIARKFYSKRPPPISTEEYLTRIHKYCPMSTAVYLATSVYITRMAIKDHVISVTPRNAHRLLLAGLRVAMKALEDLSWPHARFSKVGGVSEVELGRLEITFCFLINFELKVDAEMLREEVDSLKGGAVQDLTLNSGMKVGSKGEKRKASSTLPSRPALPVEVPAPS